MSAPAFSRPALRLVADAPAEPAYRCRTPGCAGPESRNQYSKCDACVYIAELRATIDEQAEDIAHKRKCFVWAVMELEGYKMAAKRRGQALS